jgi:hypothetical protein
MDENSERARIERELEVLKDARRDIVCDLANRGSDAAETIYTTVVQIQIAITAFEAVVAEISEGLTDDTRMVR